MCDSDIPLPNFDFDDIDEFEEISSFGATFGSPMKCRFKINISDLVKIFGFQLLNAKPVRETNNSCVYSVFTPSIESVSIKNNTIHSMFSQKYALKISTNKSRILKEYDNYNNLPNSSKLVKSYDLFEFNEFIILQMELCKGDIYGALMDEETIWKLMHDISQALNTIHYADLIHLDVSPSNILIKGNDFKLADFGNIIENGSFQPGDEGSGPYASPEVLSFPGNKENGYVHVWSAADIFSFGVVLLEAASGHFAPRGGTQMYEELRKGNVKLGQGIYKCNCSIELVSLVNSMINPDPMLRPTADRILKHPCVRKLENDLFM